MISLVHAACRSCPYHATVGIGRDEDATVPVHWAPAHCPASGMVSINVYSFGFDSEPRCHECAELVDFYVDWGMGYHSYRRAGHALTGDGAIVAPESGACYPSAAIMDEAVSVEAVKLRSGRPGRGCTPDSKPM